MVMFILTIFFNLHAIFQTKKIKLSPPSNLALSKKNIFFWKIPAPFPTFPLYLPVAYKAVTITSTPSPAHVLLSELEEEEKRSKKV